MKRSVVGSIGSFGAICRKSHSSVISTRNLSWDVVNNMFVIYIFFWQKCWGCFDNFLMIPLFVLFWQSFNKILLRSLQYNNRKTWTIPRVHPKGFVPSRTRKLKQKITRTRATNSQQLNDSLGAFCEWHGHVAPWGAFCSHHHEYNGSKWISVEKIND